MVLTLRRLWAERNHEYRVRLKEAVTVAVALTSVIAGMTVGTVVYWRDRARQTDAKIEAGLVVAAQAAYEDARSERLRCEQRVESRDQIRGAFTVVYDLIDDLTPENQFTAAARAELDRTYPTLSLDDCPPIPTPPPQPLEN